MRLLSLNSQDELTWSVFTPDKIPDYGILSHTWGTEEVTYLDLINKTAKEKAGYRKILFCGQKCAVDNLRYFWVDTCCIDKRDNNETTKAINSMFRWYHKAVKCYVYLSDVSSGTIASSPSSQQPWEADFRQSRWFHRGWTLQELLAPLSVSFYSSQHQFLGDKTSLCSLIHEITKIPIAALSGSPLNSFRVQERMSWAAERHTTEEEDAAYCLLGIFNVFMPLIYGETKENALRRLKKEIDRCDDQPASSSLPLPFERNPRFTGRETILADLEGQLFQGNATTKVAIAGLGGVGKTQIVLELAYRIQEKYSNCSVFWFPATDFDSLNLAYLNVAQHLGIAGWDEEKADVKKLVQNHLNRPDSRPWLCIFDNADDVDMWIQPLSSSPGNTRLRDYLPKSKQGCIVFTTRDNRAAVKLVGENIIDVSELSEDEAVQMLGRSLKKSLPNLGTEKHAQDALLLVRILTCLPLAIVQAAAYVNENSMPLSDYLSLLNDQDETFIELLSEEFEDDSRYQSTRNPVATTWLVSFNQIRRHDPLAANYLSFMACIDWKDIPQSILPPGNSRKLEEEALGTLKAYSFITGGGPVEMLSLHRLVHLATRNWLRSEDSLSGWNKLTIEHLTDVFPDVEYESRNQWRPLLPHVAHILKSDADFLLSNRTKELMRGYADSLLSDGQYKAAGNLYEHINEVLGIADAFSGANKFSLHVLAGLAVAYSGQGLFLKAEKLGVQISETRKVVFGEENPDTLTSMGNLAAIYLYQGRYQEAEELQVRLVEISKKVLGEEHPGTLTSMGNLAVTYRYQGRYQEAEELQVRLVELRKKALGEEHPDTLISIGNLASTYRFQGRYQEAEELEVRLVKISKKVLGEEHPRTLINIRNLAATYQYQGRYQEAEKILLPVLEVALRVFGENHPTALIFMHNWATLLRDLYRNEEALIVMRECVRLRKEKLGAYHPETIKSISWLEKWNSDEMDIDFEIGRLSIVDDSHTIVE